MTKRRCSNEVGQQLQESRKVNREIAFAPLLSVALPRVHQGETADEIDHLRGTKAMVV